MLLAQNNPQEPQDLGVDIPANFPFLISILQFKIRNFPNPVPNHNVSPFSAVTGKANQRSINYSRLSPEQAVLLFQLVVRKECTLSAPPPPPRHHGVPLNVRSLSLDFQSRALNLQTPTKQTY